MLIDKKELKHICKLSNIKLTEKELNDFSNNLSDVLKYFKKLEELDTKKIKPTHQVTGLQNVFREDVKKDYHKDSRKEMLKSVPRLKNGYIIVPKTI